MNAERKTAQEPRYHAPEVCRAGWALGGLEREIVVTKACPRRSTRRRSAAQPIGKRGAEVIEAVQGAAKVRKRRKMSPEARAFPTMKTLGGGRKAKGKRQITTPRPRPFSDARSNASRAAATSSTAIPRDLKIDPDGPRHLRAAAEHVAQFGGDASRRTRLLIGITMSPASASAPRRESTKTRASRTTAVSISR
jgi:hypothetical protein